MKTISKGEDRQMGLNEIKKAFYTTKEIVSKLKRPPVESENIFSLGMHQTKE
jgi:hypothetical protein